MNCEQVRELLSAYLDNALALKEQQAVATHLESCLECSNFFADLRHLDTLLSLLPRINPDQTLREKIFSSSQYLEITGMGRTVDEQTVSPKRMQCKSSRRPHLIALPGGRCSPLPEFSNTSISPKDQPQIP